MTSGDVGFENVEGRQKQRMNYRESSGNGDQKELVMTGDEL